MALLCLVLAPRSRAAEAPAAARPIATRDVSFSLEVQHAIDRGLAWLASHQNSNGWWSTPDHPAVTALALMAWAGRPEDSPGRAPAGLRRGYDFLLQCVQPDGGIHRSNLVTYNTALSMMALLAAREPAYESTIRRARRFLVGLQSDFGEKGRADDVFDGGIGYGTKYSHSDMGNTLAALEALHYSRHLARDRHAGEPDLNWEAAIRFLQNCQNLPAYNKQDWVSDDPKHRGGFIYYPGHSMAGAETNAATGRVALRSYGSISYGGMLSYIYAQLPPEDPRVRAVFDWLRANYTLDENPGMGPQGRYFYFHTMAKALTAAGVTDLELRDGRRVPWRRELAMKLLNLQQPDGSWINTEHARWWEKDPALVTSYAVLALEMIHRGGVALQP
ncbi:MAG TPA: prenyltransferase/squalene oxidase repeat-containing protein [Methylomirabilota bacterium]|nr:prenyltransferase/squalene oxidase repeat-containing protein [Methylomirabilota bacterium]